MRLAKSDPHLRNTILPRAYRSVLLKFSQRIHLIIPQPYELSLIE
jgi:hypothetical protein